MSKDNNINQIENRMLKCIEGIFFSYKMVENINKKLYNSCLEIFKDKQKIFDTLQLCWSFIDSVHRIREILYSFPRLKKSDRILKLFLSNTDVTETFRNYIQHLRQELTKPINDQFPVMGSLSWVDDTYPTKCHSIIIGTQIEKVKFSYCVYDKENEEWVSKVCLSIFDCVYNFDLIFKELNEYMYNFALWLDNNDQKISSTFINPIVSTLEIKQNVKKGSKYEKILSFSNKRLN